jgi:hypothetical protein
VAKERKQIKEGNTNTKYLQRTIHQEQMKRYEEASNAEKHQIENAIASSPV